MRRFARYTLVKTLALHTYAERFFSWYNITRYNTGMLRRMARANARLDVDKQEYVVLSSNVGDLAQLSFRCFAHLSWSDLLKLQIRALALFFVLQAVLVVPSY